MKNTKRLFAAVMALAVVSAMAPVSAFADDAITLTLTKANPYDVGYILTIPANATITDTGWTALEDLNVKYNGEKSFDPAKKITVTAESANSWKLVSTEADTMIGYTMKSTSTDTEATTEWEFSAEEINKKDSSEKVVGTSKSVGIDVSATDYEAAIAATYTDTITFNVAVEDVEAESTEIDLSKLKGDYEAKDGDVLINTLAGNYKITIADGATVTLKNAVIEETDTTDSEDKWAGITANGDATIMLEGNNSVKSFNYGYPGIIVPDGNTLTIKGSGSLTTVGATCGAGIGGGDTGINCGNIVIEGGTIDAKGSTYGAGIGGGYKGSCGSVTIKNTVTKVTATKGMAAKSIGSGQYGTCGTITIGGTVTGMITESPYTYEP